MEQDSAGRDPAGPQPEPHHAQHAAVWQHNDAALMPATRGEQQACVAPLSIVPAGPAPVVTALDAASQIALQRINFESKAQAMAWLGGACYNRVRPALSELGVTSSSEVMLLQAAQLEGCAAIKTITRNKMCILLDKLVSESDRLQLVFETHRAWLEENLEMVKAGRFWNVCKSTKQHMGVHTYCGASGRKHISSMTY